MANTTLEDLILGRQHLPRGKGPVIHYLISFKQPSLQVFEPSRHTQLTER